MSQPTASVVFTVEELWLLQSCVRHEAAQMDAWRFPPASLALNDEIADALVRCDDCGLTEAALLLTRADCLAIDHTVPQTAKSAAGVAVGKSTLMKSFRARRDIDEGLRPPVAVDGEPEQAELDARLEEWKNRRRRRRSK